MQIIDRRREGDVKPLPKNWGILPDSEFSLPDLVWIVDLDRFEIHRWGLGQVQEGELIIYVGPEGRE